MRLSIWIIQIAVLALALSASATDRSTRRIRRPNAACVISRVLPSESRRPVEAASVVDGSSAPAGTLMIDWYRVELQPIRYIPPKKTGLSFKEPAVSAIAATESGSVPAAESKQVLVVTRKLGPRRPGNAGEKPPGAPTRAGPDVGGDRRVWTEYDVRNAATEALSSVAGRKMELGEPIGGGGMRTVYNHPTDPTKLVKVYDPRKRTPAEIATRIQSDLAKEDFLLQYLEEYKKRHPKRLPPFRVVRTNRDPLLLERGVLVVDKAEGIGLDAAKDQGVDVLKTAKMQRFYQAMRELEPRVLRLEEKITGGYVLSIEVTKRMEIFLKELKTPAERYRGANGEMRLRFGLDIFGWNNVYIGPDGIPILVDP